jgi:hypothetical protein
LKVDKTMKGGYIFHRHKREGLANNQTPSVWIKELSSESLQAAMLKCGNKKLEQHPFEI